MNAIGYTIYCIIDKFRTKLYLLSVLTALSGLRKETTGRKLWFAKKKRNLRVYPYSNIDKVIERNADLRIRLLVYRQPNPVRMKGTCFLT
jgi:hypothetical protein